MSLTNSNKLYDENSDNNDLIALLNKALSSEYQASMQYQQHFNNTKGKFLDVINHFKVHMDEENGHAQALCMRICSLGGTPTTTIDPLAPFTADIDEALKQDILAEKKAIKLYTEILDLCEQTNDRATEMLIEKILGDEVDHLDEFCKFRKVFLK